nr:hypothetical protein [Tanacetum cinerariifolium]
MKITFSNHDASDDHFFSLYNLYMIQEIGYTLDAVRTYISIIDDDTFPQQKFLITAPEPLNLLRHAKTVGSVDGLVCFGGWYKDNKMVVLWNPSIRKSVAIRIPNVIDSLYGYTRIGFGVCPHTNDPKLVRINVTKTLSICWEVHVFTLSSRVWKTVYTDGVNQPFTKIYTVKVEGKPVFSTNVLGFRNNGDVVLEIVGDDYTESTLEVYEPSSGHINGVGIKGDSGVFSASSYKETLLLLDESNSTRKHYFCLMSQILSFSFSDSEDGL